MRQIFYKSVVLAACLTLLSISSCKKDDDAKISNNISKRTPVDDPDVEVEDAPVDVPLEDPVVLSGVAGGKSTLSMM